MTVVLLHARGSRGAQASRRWSAWSVTSLALLVWALIPVAVLIARSIAHGGVIAGSTGASPGGDQLFYLSEVRQSGSHLLIGDQFAIGLGHRVFLDPFYLLGGILWRIGVPVQAAFWALSLPAVAALAAGVVGLAFRALESGRRRAAAIVLALLYFSPITAAVLWTGHLAPLTITGVLDPAWEAMPFYNLWGYPHSDAAIGLLALAILGCVSIAERRASRGRVALVAAAACATGWIHPWQGATFVIVALVLVLTVRSRDATIRIGLAIVAAALPMLYEWVLSHVDAAWKIDAAGNAVGHPYVWAVAAALGPLVLVAVPGARRCAPGPLRTALLAWPVGAIVVYLATAQFPYHAFGGITLPLAVLAVAGLSGDRRAAGTRRTAISDRVLIGAAAIALLSGAAGLGYEVKLLREAQNSPVAPYVLRDSDAAALGYLDRQSASGGVLAREYVGVAVPALAGRSTWVGQWTWTPAFNARYVEANALMAGQMTPAQARQFVLSTRARFVLLDCGSNPSVARQIAAIVDGSRRFGCAAVLRVR